MSSAQQQIATRPTVELVEIGERRISTRGWALELFLQHLQEHLARPNGKWCDVACMARTMWGRNTPTNRAAVRRSAARGFRGCLLRGLFVVIEYAGPEHHGQILAWKLFDRATADDAERQHASEQLARMQRRRELSSELVAKAGELIGT